MIYAELENHTTLFFFHLLGRTAEKMIELPSRAATEWVRFSSSGYIQDDALWGIFTNIWRVVLV